LREVRDPVHGFIYRTSLEEAIIDTPIMQRLRRIKQLAMASLVYPGALHTRFDHSLGVMHLTGKLTEKLMPYNYDEENRLLRLAALLHDIGHGPFSHVSEEIIDKYYDRSKVKLKKGEKAHELITLGLLKYDPKLTMLLSGRDIEMITGLLTGTRGEPIFKNILSGPLDTDKQDYLLRDSYFCGVKYGIFDIDRMLETLEVLEGDEGRLLAIAQDAVHTLEQFILAKYYMTTQVYLHKVRLVSDAMIVRAIELGIEVDKIEYLKKLYKFDNSERFYREWMVYDDDILTSTICSEGTPEGYAKKIFYQLRNRKLFKRIFHVNLNALVNTLDAHGVYELSQGFNNYKKRLERIIGEMLRVDPLEVIVNKFTIQSVRTQSRNEEEPIMVKPLSGPPQNFEEVSTLFRSINEAEKDEILEVYAPVDFIDENHKRSQLQKYHHEILEIISEIIQKEDRYKEE